MEQVPILATSRIWGVNYLRRKRDIDDDGMPPLPETQTSSLESKNTPSPAQSSNAGSSRLASASSRTTIPSKPRATGRQQVSETDEVRISRFFRTFDWIKNTTANTPNATPAIQETPVGPAAPSISERTLRPNAPVFTPFNPVSQVNQVNRVNQADLINPVNQVNVINPLNPLNTLNSLNPSNHLNPLNPLNYPNFLEANAPTKPKAYCREFDDGQYKIGIPDQYGHLFEIDYRDLASRIFESVRPHIPVSKEQPTTYTLPTRVTIVSGIAVLKLTYDVWRALQSNKVPEKVRKFMRLAFVKEYTYQGPKGRAARAYDHTYPQVIVTKYDGDREAQVFDWEYCIYDESPESLEQWNHMMR